MKIYDDCITPEYSSHGYVWRRRCEQRPGGGRGGGGGGGGGGRGGGGVGGGGGKGIHAGVRAN